MGLKFLEIDENMLYIQKLAGPTKEAFQASSDLYKKGKHPAILVIDMQNGCTSPKSVLGPKTEEMQKFVYSHVENTKILLDAARKKNIPIIYFAGGHYRNDGLDCGVFGEKITTLVPTLQEGSWEVEIDDMVKPQPGDFFMVKKHQSAFAGTDIVAQLNTLKVDTCIVVGYSTSGCVRATVNDAVAYGYWTVVPEECVADRFVWVHKANLFDIWSKIADVVSLDDVLDWIKTF
ncbi:isochorismatase family protein [Chloroflexota bacterium]